VCAPSPPEVLATARAQHLDPAEVLRVLLVEEVMGRDAATRRQRGKAAGFPTGKTFEFWRETESSILAASQRAHAHRDHDGVVRRGAPA
jgi:hypothetical protein